MKIMSWIQTHAITVAATLMLSLMVSNTACLLYNNHVLETNTALKADSERIRELNALLWNDIVRNLDIGLRGYALTRDTALLTPYRSSLARKDRAFQELASLLQAPPYQALTGLDSLRTAINAYQQQCTVLLDLVDAQDSQAVSQQIRQDRSKQLWLTYAAFTNRLHGLMDRLNQGAEYDYRAATQRTTYLQLLLLFIGIPSLLFILARIRRENQRQQALFNSLENNHRTYLFDPGTPMQNLDEQLLLTASSDHFRQAVGFIQQLARGNYQVAWKGLDPANQPSNQSTLAGELERMRERMSRTKLEEEQRLWASEGIARFSEIIRQHQHHLPSLSDQLVAFVTKYLQAQQGSLFLLSEEGEPALELAACYAFDRKKFLTKRVAIGQGLVGQTYLERCPTLLTDLPPGYTHITSGLGEATPGCLLVVPMMYNEQVEAIIEIASFQRLQAHQVEWLAKVGEIAASTLVSVKNSQQTRALLEASRQHTEEMKAQEEELRQNMEELQAIQEEMARKQVELVGQNTALNNAAIVSEVDLQGYILFANEEFCRVSQYSRQELVGQKQSIVRHPDTPAEVFGELWSTITKGQVWRGEIKNRAKDGSAYWVAATITPVLGEHGKPIKYIGVRFDITAQRRQAETIASSLEAVQEQAEQIAAQESALRQNMEELEVAQQQMRHQAVAHLEEIERLNQLHQTNTAQLSAQEAAMSSVVTAVNRTLATIEFDPQGTILSANEQFLRVMGYQLEEVVGRHHRMLVEPAYGQSPQYQTFWEELREGRAQTGQVKRLSSSGQPVWLSASYTPVLEEGHRVSKIIKFAHDITDQKQAALDYESQLSAIAKSNAVVEFDLQGHILSANENFLSLLDYPWEALKGQHHRLLVGEQERDSPQYLAFWQQLRSGTFITGEFRRISRQGQQVWIRGSYNAILDDSGQPYKVVKYAQDITLQKRLEAETQQQTEELRAQEEEIRQNLEELQAIQEEVERKSEALEAHLAAINRTLATVEFTPEGKILAANDHFLSWLGYQAEELLQQPHHLLVEKDYRQSKAYAQFWQHLRQGQPQVGQVRRLTKDGKLVHLHASYTPVFDRQNCVVKIIKLAQLTET